MVPWLRGSLNLIVTGVCLVPGQMGIGATLETYGSWIHRFWDGYENKFVNFVC